MSGLMKTGVKGKHILETIFSYQCSAIFTLRPFGPKIDKLILVKREVLEYRCKGKAVMFWKPFPVINDLWLSPFVPIMNRAHA